MQWLMCAAVSLVSCVKKAEIKWNKAGILFPQIIIFWKKKKYQNEDDLQNIRLIHQNASTLEQQKVRILSVKYKICIL